MKAIITIMPKRERLHSESEALRQQLRGLGFEEVQGLRLGRHLEIDLTGAQGDVRELVAAMCEELLVNEMTEEVSFVIDADSHRQVAAHSEGAGG